jgi:hypothetical protein
MNGPSQQTRKYKKGELIFQESEAIDKLFLIHSGKVKTFLQRGKNPIELQQISAPSVLGENMIFSSAKQMYSCISLTEVTLLEIPVESLKVQIEGSGQIIKFLIKALVDQLKNLNSSVKTFRLESDNAPCSDEIVPRLFGGVFHYISHLGEKQKDGRVLVSWPLMKQYTSRIFNLNQEKVENLLHILTKFKMAEYVFEKLDDDPSTSEQLSKIYITNPNKIEQFFDFFQYYFYKSGKQDFLKVDETLFHLVRGILQATEKETPDRQGNIRAPLNMVLESVKTNQSINVTATHWTLLDQKGLFSKRHDVNGIFYILFNLEEFQRCYNGWRFIREIAKWNQTGTVNPKEPEFTLSNTTESALKCPGCQNTIQAHQKFCGECGAKLSQAA